MGDKVEFEEETGRDTCRCPFCEGETSRLFPFCQSCGVRLRTCPNCCEPVPGDATACPKCGARVD